MLQQRSVLTFLILALGGTAGVAAQETREEMQIRHREECREAARLLVADRAAEKRAWALGIINACPQLTDVLTHLWQDPPEDERNLSRLYWLSRGVRDRDIFEATFEVASSPSRPALPRITALGVLASYVNPDLTLGLSGLEPLEGWGPIEWNNIWGPGADLPLQVQEDPLPKDFGERTLTLTRRLAEEAGDDRVRSSAWWLLRAGRFEELAPTNPPPDTTEVSWVRTPPDLWDPAARELSADEREPRQAECRRAGRVLTEGGTWKDRRGAFRIIHACPQLSDVLAGLWRDPLVRDGENLQALFRLTRWLRGRDAFEVAFDVARSRNRPPLVRIAALGVLGTYVDSTLALHLDRLETGEESKPVAWDDLWGSAPEHSMLTPRAPLPDAFTEKTLALTRRLSEQADDARVRAAAAALLRRLGAAGNARASCLPLDEDVAAFETHVEELATSSDSVYTATREEYGFLAVPESEVERITDRQICSDAAKAYKQVVGLQGQATSVHVVRVGTRYIVFNPDVKGGEWVVFVVFDDQFNKLAIFTG